ncbi:Short-chain collagen C4 [Holothuria leucospilota]|uniref:Short-chain collagen C4 n=1 Tax=Holothuria leucospilota TaxID=206669 RepID=A0A9Q1C4Y7_HOLLE|nr:Short-chain collagen C4 [Holothuria leucospilota]
MNRIVLVCLLSVVLCHVAWANLSDESPQNMRRENAKDVHEGEQQTQSKRTVSNCQNHNGASKGGSVYVRWGRRDCPEASDLLYSGIAAGSRHRDSPGGGANILCLPPDPSFVNPVDGVGGTRAFLYSIEYQLSNYPAWQQNHLDDVPCAVCKATGRFSHVMIPAKQTCPSSEWTLEYRGYLMAERSHPVHHKSMFVCVDHDPKVVPNSSSADNQNSGRLSLVEGKCSTTGGGLPCNTYPNGKEFTCAVCTL